MLDSGSIVAGDQKQPVHELELELRRGALGALYGLALSLHAATPLSIEAEGKAARGYRLMERSAPTTKEAAWIELKSDVAARDGFRAIVGEILSHLLSNKSAALAGDAEGVHQIRSRDNAAAERVTTVRAAVGATRGGGVSEQAPTHGTDHWSCA